MKYFYLIALVVFVAFSLLAIPFFIPQAPGFIENLSWENGFVPTEPEVSLVFVGDMMLDRGVNFSVQKNFGGDFNQLFTELDFIREADIAFGNLEGPVSDKGRNIGSIYSFRMKPESLQAVAAAGFDVLSVANNHAGDWTSEAFVDTVARIKNLNILPIGGGNNYQEASLVKIKEVRGVKVGFIGFSDVGPNWLAVGSSSPGILLASDPQFDQIIKTAAESVDVLVTSFHFGEEYLATSTSRQQVLARRAIDNGASLVIGHHPHVIEELERYKNGVIIYSLGNFIFDQGFSKETMEGGVLFVKLDGKKIESAELKKVKLDSRFKPSPAW
ncbi:MAG: CapA family protein [Candidatus Vogelbacteria bacterium]|nr:CapA family protein [Candidatus Vogelbacteria bacterium]